MKVYGSLINRMVERSTYEMPRVGQPVTEYMWSDRVPYHITRIITPSRIEVVPAFVSFKRDGYPLAVLPGTGSGVILRWSEGKHAWVRVGDTNGSKFRLNVLDPYHDPEF